MAHTLGYEAFQRRCALCGIRGTTVEQAWSAYTHRKALADVDDVLTYFIVPTDVTGGDGEPQRKSVVDLNDASFGSAQRPGALHKGCTIGNPMHAVRAQGSTSNRCAL